MVDLATGEQAARHFFSKAGARTARRKTGTVPIFRLESGACPIQMGTVPVFRLSAQQAARLSREVRQHRAVRVRHQARPVDGNAELRDARRLFGEPGADRRVEILARKTGEEAKAHRSEEHTSELQSPMRISSAVF